MPNIINISRFADGTIVYEENSKQYQIPSSSVVVTTSKAGYVKIFTGIMSVDKTFIVTDLKKINNVNVNYTVNQVQQAITDLVQDVFFSPNLDIIVELQTLNAVDFSTEATSFDIKNLIASLKDLDGVKKITDAVNIANAFNLESTQILIKDLLSGKLDISLSTMALILADIKNKTDNLVANPALETGNLKSIFDFFNSIAIITGPNTGIKGLRVYGGPTDPISDVPVKMEYDHHQIHEGESFRWSVYISSLANNATKDIEFVVPDIVLNPGETYIQKCPHFRFQVFQSNDGLVQLFEAPTVSVEGTTRTPIALERNGTYTPKMLIKEDPTITSTGNLIWQGVNSATKNNASTIENSSDEFVLKNNTKYLLRTTSLGNSNRVLIRILFYEDLGV